MGSLVAYNFPERQYKEIFKKMSQVLNEEVVSFEPADWPHISIVYLNQSLSKEENDQIIAELKDAKPEFKILGVDVFSGERTPYAYLVLKLSKPTEYESAVVSMEKKFELTRMHELAPHMSVLRVPKAEQAKLAGLKDKLYEAAKASMYPFKPTSTMIWENFRAVQVGEGVVFERRFIQEFIESHLDETVQSDREIRWMAQSLAKTFKSKAMRKGEKGLTEPLSIGQFSGSHEYGEIEDFVHSSGVTVMFSPNLQAVGASATSRGVFVPAVKSVLLQATKNDLDEVGNAKDMDDPKFINKFVDSRVETLVHELIHAYDDWRSKGKNQKKDYSNDPSTNKYWLSQLEINAQFADTAKSLESMKLTPDDDEFRGRGLKDYIEAFKGKIGKWEDMPKDVQKRLLGRMQQEFMNVSNKEKDGILLSRASTLMFDLDDLKSPSLLPTEKDPRLKGDAAYTKNQLHTVGSLLKDALESPSGYADRPYSAARDMLRYAQTMLNSKSPLRTNDWKNKYTSLLKSTFGFTNDEIDRIIAMEESWENDSLGISEEKHFDRTQDSVRNADKKGGGLPCSYQSKKLSTEQKKRSQSLSSRRCLYNESTTLPKLDKTSMNESLQSLVTSLVFEQTNSLRLVHDYFLNKPDTDSTRQLFIQFLKEPDLSQIEPIESSSLAGKRGKFRVRLDDSKHRIILTGRIEFKLLFVDTVSFFNYDEDGSYKKYLDQDVDEDTAYHDSTDKLKHEFDTNEDLKEEESGTLTLWHGGNLDSNVDMVAHKGGRWEHGPGLYLTTHYDTAKKYAKGSRKLYKVVVKKGTEISSVKLPEADALEFVNTWVISSKRKSVAERLGKWIKDGQIDASIFLNTLINEEALKPASTEKLRTFLVEHGIDYVIVDNAFGWHERMLVLFNMAKIVSKNAVGSDKIDTFDLPTEFEEAVSYSVSGTKGSQYFVDPKNKIYRFSDTHEDWARKYCETNDIPIEDMARNALLRLGWVRLWWYRGKPEDSLECETMNAKDFMRNELPFIVATLKIDPDTKIEVDEFEAESSASDPFESGLIRDFIESMNEMAAPTSAMKSETFWHGSSDESRLDSIWQQGIKPDMDLDKYKGGTATPVAGRVYITSDLPYAIIYALGGDFAGTNIPKAFIKDGKYGHVFKIPGLELVDVHPDEDNVGRAVHDEAFPWLKKFHAELKKHKSPGYRNLYDGVVDGEYDAWIQAGKIILPLLSDGEKHEIIAQYKNIAHAGVVMPTEVWQIDKSRSKELKRDGSNFFEVAKLLKKREPEVKETKMNEFIDDPNAPIEAHWVDELETVIGDMQFFDRKHQKDLKEPIELLTKAKEMVAAKKTETMDEAKKKRKKRMGALAAYFGKGDGKGSPATIPPYRAPNAMNPSLGPSLPGPSGVNGPQFGTLPPMVSSIDYDAQRLGLCLTECEELP